MDQQVPVTNSVGSDLQTCRHSDKQVTWLLHIRSSDVTDKFNVSTSCGLLISYAACRWCTVSQGHFDHWL